MAARFHRTRRAPSAHEDAQGNSGFGDWWAAVAVMGLAGLAVLSLGGSHDGLPTHPTSDPSKAMLALIEPAETSLREVEAAFAELCREPVLLALELEPDCETGVITLPDSLFGGFGSAALRPEAKEDVLAAIRIYLGRLRDLPALWSSLEEIEIRGHSDPRAVRTPYVTNMVGSQQRPLGLLLFLVGEGGLDDVDRADFERLAVLSGVSFSRPPATCPEQTRECYAEWRRVEIRPQLSESLRRGDWSRTLEDVRVTAARLQAESEAVR